MNNRQLSYTLAVLLLISADFAPASYIATAPVGGAMGGASTCITAGAVMFVNTTPGVCNQDATNFFWDNSNKRLGLGTNAPDTRLHMNVTTNLDGLKISATGTNITPTIRLYDSVTSADGRNWGIALDMTSFGDFQLRQSTAKGGDPITAGTSVISSILNRAVGIGSGNTAPTGTLYIYDATATTGVTVGSVRAGAGQSTTDLWQWLANNGSTVLGRMTSAGRDVATLWGSETNCSSSASPAVCAAAPAGSVVVAAAATTVVVNTTAVTANSQIFVEVDQGLGSKLSVTCNATVPTAPLVISARTAGTSFTITATAPITNPLCISYAIFN